MVYVHVDLTFKFILKTHIELLSG